MRFAPTPEQEEFRRTVRDLLAGPGAAGKSWAGKSWAGKSWAGKSWTGKSWEGEPGAADGPGAGEPGAADGPWRALADVGAPALTVPERYGGLGLGAEELVAVLEETGRACLPEPLLENTVAARLLADAAPDSPQAAHWLPRFAAGEARLALVLPPEPFAVGGAEADLVLVGQGGELYALESGHAVPVPGVDPGRPPARIELPSGRAPLAPACGPAVERAALLAALGAAAELLGAALRMLELAVAHTGAREQFGRPVGSFQAVKHHLADVLMAIEFARPVVLRAAHSFDRGLPSWARDASMAKVFASDAAERAARSCLQVHGAIGYTEEHGLARLMRRSWTLSAAWGDAGHHRAAVAADLLGPAPAPACPPR
ncbi:acyl-CoA dehydrogenase family protein [Wenjunlia tyrosinilytica]|uniref:Acyl-CoA dehydrogenase n=1 Tax=Wenjunlia tyrosinilytica TaxID=1544741 RepID=A0A917ZLU4_9ACTN|nr:acyl-CoA dehydrogenase family protein [Wenjunlia tyrosinilytica]GGO86739.1 acyl-CoA dehydrogenase [Wenjunlia tyrosinilytica]